MKKEKLENGKFVLKNDKGEKIVEDEFLDATDFGEQEIEVVDEKSKKKVKKKLGFENEAVVRMLDENGKIKTAILKTDGTYKIPFADYNIMKAWNSFHIVRNEALSFGIRNHQGELLNTKNNVDMPGSYYFVRFLIRKDRIIFQTHGGKNYEFSAAGKFSVIGG